MPKRFFQTPQKPKESPLEKTVEKKVCDYAKSLGFLVYKFTSPSRRSVPDRMFVSPMGVIFFIEFKREGKLLTAGQAVEIEKLRGNKVTVYMVSSVEDGKSILRRLSLGLDDF